MDRPATRGDAVDVDALGTADELSPRRTLVRRALAGAAFVGGAVVLGRRLQPAAAATPSPSQDEKIFNFALLLEYLQAAFYTRAVDDGALRGELRDFAETVAGHERAHVAYLRNVLGPKARERPEFDFGGATGDQRRFSKTALLLENIGVSAYNGQAANLTKKGLAAAVEIVSVEGRHAAWISDITGADPAPRAADPGESATTVAAALRATGFLKSA